MRRAGILLLLLLTLAVTGCGGHSHAQTGSPLDEAVGYFAKDAPFVAAIETNPNGGQIKQLSDIAGRFPGRDIVVNRLLTLSRFRFVDWERDLRPQLGAPLVVGLVKPAAGADVAVATVLAMHLQHPVRAKQVLLRQPGFRANGKESGVRIYENPPENRYFAVDHDVLVAATNRDILAEALAMKHTGNRMRESDFKRDLAGLPAGGLLRVSADPKTMLGADPRLRPALGVRWIAALRRMGAVVKAAPTGLSLDLHVATDRAALRDDDLPLAPGRQALPLIGGRNELQVAVRDPNRLARFAFAVWRAIAPASLKRFEALQPHGVDLERQLPHHLADLAQIAYDPVSRDFALRSTLNDAADVRASLATLAPALPALGAMLGIKGLGVASAAPGESFYALASPKGRTAVFGVLGNSLVAASDAVRAAGLVSESTHQLPAARGSAVLTVNARALAGRLLAKQLSGPAALVAPLAVASLRDLTGALTISRSGLDGHFRLTIVR